MKHPPLTPPNCNLRDFAFMPVDVQRVLESETWLGGSGDARAAALALWLRSWHQVPAGSLPNNDLLLAQLSTISKWRAVKQHALRGWIECSDGRLYHPVVCEKVLEAWIEKLLNSMSGSAGNAKRWNVDIDTTGTRAQLLTAIRMLRELAPQSKTLKKKAVVSIAAGSPPDSHPDSPPDSPPDSSGDRKGQGQGQGLSIKASTSNSTSRGSDPVEFAPTKAGQVGMALKAAGVDMTKVNLADPLFGALLQQGATVEEFAGLAREALESGKRSPWKWILATLPARREDAQRMQLAPKQASQSQETERQRLARERTAEAAGVYSGHIAKDAPGYPSGHAINDDEVIHVGPNAITFGND